MGLTRVRATNILDSDYKQSCRVATTGSVTLSGGAPNTVDGKSLSLGDRVLVKAQSPGSQNGIYKVTTLGTGSNGTWTRDVDAIAAYSISPGMTVYVEEGNSFADTYWYVSTTGNIVIDSTSITFSNLSTAVGGGGGTVTVSGNTFLQFANANNLSNTTYLQYNYVSGNLVSNSTTTSTSTTTGAIVAPSAGISGNLYVGNIITTSGIYYPNGATAGGSAGGSGITYTAATTPPVGPKNGDQWYNTSTDILYEYATDGSNSFWIDIQSPIITATGNNMAATFSTVTVNGVTQSNGNIWANSGTASTNTTTGALVVSGGVGVSGNVYIGANAIVTGNIVVNSSTTSSSTTTGAIVVTGGVGVGGRLYAQQLTAGFGAMNIDGGTGNFGSSGGASSPTYGFGTGAVSAGYIKTLNIGTSGAAGSNLVINMGSVNANGNIFISSNTVVYSANTQSSTSSTTGAIVVAGGIGASGNLFVGGLANIAYSGSADSALAIVGADTKGGAGYHDFLKITNTGGGTNPNKYFRLDSTGNIQIINSGYTGELFRLTDSGDATVFGNLSINGVKSGYSSARPGFRVYGSGTTNNLTPTQNTYGALNNNNWTADFNQGSYLNGTTGVFTAPVTGMYQVNIVGRNAGNTTTISQLAVVKNGSSGGLVGGTVQIMIEFAASSTMNHTGGSSVILLNANDTLALKVLSGTINFDVNDNWSVAYIG